MYGKKPMYKKGGKKFPDLTGDGKVTRADVLKGRGVFKEGGIKKVKKGPVGGTRRMPTGPVGGTTQDKNFRNVVERARKAGKPK